MVDIYMIKFEANGDFRKTKRYLRVVKNLSFSRLLKDYGERGVDALRSATPKDTGKTAESWSYEIRTTRDSASIYWKNSNTSEGVPIAILLQYGHGTRNGGYVRGIDYINPTIRPIFEEMANTLWKEMTKD